MLMTPVCTSRWRLRTAPDRGRRRACGRVSPCPACASGCAPPSFPRTGWQRPRLLPPRPGERTRHAVGHPTSQGGRAATRGQQRSHDEHTEREQRCATKPQRLPAATQRAGCLAPAGPGRGARCLSAQRQRLQHLWRHARLRGRRVLAALALDGHHAAPAARAIRALAALEQARLLARAARDGRAWRERAVTAGPGLGAGRRRRRARGVSEVGPGRPWGRRGRPPAARPHDAPRRARARAPSAHIISLDCPCA